MQNHAKAEQDLSEEQLQEITGGCAQCQPDMNNAIAHLTATTYHQQQADAYASGIARTSSVQNAQQLHNLSQTHQDWANYHGQQAQNWSQSILTRHSGGAGR